MGDLWAKPQSFPDEQLCANIEGFRCVPSKDCVASVDDLVFGKEFDETLASCFEVDIRAFEPLTLPRSSDITIQDLICCKEEQIKCSTLPKHRCVPNAQCEVPSTEEEV